MATPLENVILEELSCPSCYNYMSPPINQCISGHNVCHDCFVKISKCPTCRTDKSDSRNYALEAIFRSLNLPCKNQHLGCDYKCLGDSLDYHHKYCWFIKNRCPFTHYDSCSWKDSMKTLKDHLLLKHSSNFYQKDKQKFISQNFRKIKCYHYIFAVIYVHENYFRLTWEINEATGMSRWAVYFMGGPKEAKKYYFKLEINDSANNYVPLTFKSVCHAKPEKHRDKFGGHNCFYIHKSLLDSYCDFSGDLHYKVSICPLEVREEEYVSDLSILFTEEN